MKNKGFILVEIIIIICFSGIIGLIGYKNYLKGQRENRDMKRRADMEELQRTLDHYYQVYWEFPKEIIFGQKLIDPDGQPFLHKNANNIPETMPEDPVSKNGYRYTYESKDKERLTYRICAIKLENSPKPYCFTDDKREQFKKDTQKLYQEQK